MIDILCYTYFFSRRFRRGHRRFLQHTFEETTAMRYRHGVCEIVFMKKGIFLARLRRLPRSVLKRVLISGKKARGIPSRVTLSNAITTKYISCSYICVVVIFVILYLFLSLRYMSLMFRPSLVLPTFISK